MTTLELSVVVPCHNEAENLRPLLLAIHAAVDTLGLNFEVVITDDCSSDDSWRILQELAATDRRLRVQRFKFNCGESAASWTGMQAARGRYIATLDADLQNDPKDLLAMTEAVKRYDCVCGTRVETRGEGDSWFRIISSRIANWSLKALPSPKFRCRTIRAKPGKVITVFGIVCLNLSVICSQSVG